MDINELYSQEYNEENQDGKIVADFIKQDGFDMAGFSLFQVVSGIWEFVSNENPQKGFLIFFDSKVENEPVAGYEIMCGSVAFTYRVGSIAEAVALHHNLTLPDNNREFRTFSNAFARSEQNEAEKIRRFAEKYGITAASEAFNVTPHYINHLLRGESFMKTDNYKADATTSSYSNVKTDNIILHKPSGPVNKCVLGKSCPGYKFTAKS